MNCPYCETLTEENLRRAFETLTPYRHPRLKVVKGWYEGVSPEGKPGAQADFSCDACGQTTTVFVELQAEKDPADWWKA
jgi:DNA-directed RNA polymerase subunit M/transcription elongation factor TFIIS